MITLAADWRVRPLDHLQWVLERRYDPRPGRLQPVREVWHPYAYCRTKAGLETALSRLRCKGIALDPALLVALPDFFSETQTGSAGVGSPPALRGSGRAPPEPRRG
jgi:hypothetical protein